MGGYAAGYLRTQIHLAVSREGDLNWGIQRPNYWTRHLLITQLIMLRVYDIFSSTLYSNQAIIIYVISLTVPSSLGELTQAMFVTLESCELLQVTASLKWHIRKKTNLRKRGNLPLSVVTHTSFYAWNLQSSIVAPKGNFWLNLLF